MDTIAREPQSNNNVFATHQIVMSTLLHLLPQLKLDTQTLYLITPWREVAAVVVFTMTTSTFWWYVQG
jgi:broad specificity phosphatase PhoE